MAVSSCFSSCAARKRVLRLAIIVVSGASLSSSATLIQAEKVNIEPVWAADPVNFDFQTTSSYQYVAFYDSIRRMTVGQRSLGATTWKLTILPQTTGWDSHNYVTLAVDDSGYIHVSGNMHNVALVYYRSSKPNDVSAFTAPGMVGSNETSVTYPVFINGPNHQLFFQYRDGGSGNGNNILNSNGITTKKWTRIPPTTGLFNGGGTANAYQTTPILGPDGYFHVIWMWRNTPVANTNHDISYMKSIDLKNWLTITGTAITPPVTQSTPGVVVDPVPAGNGLINMNFWVSFDTHNRPVVTYHKYNKYDSTGISEYYNTRWETTAWKVYQTSSWPTYRWPLDLQGTLAANVSATPLELDDAGRLVQDYSHIIYGKGRWILDEPSMQPTEDTAFPIPPAEAAMYTVQSPFPGMLVQLVNKGEYFLKWETLPPNADTAVSPPLPAPSMLTMYRFIQSTGVSTAAGRAGNNEGFTATYRNGRIRIVAGVLRPASPCTVRLSTFSGRIIAGKDFIMGANVIEWNTGALAKGVYCLMVSGRAGDSRHTGKVFVY